MIFQLNLAVIFAVICLAASRRYQPILVRNSFLLPTLGLLVILVLWWVISLVKHVGMPILAETQAANFTHIFHHFYQ
ncbi:MAG: hypothetical protein VKL59_09285 [Nostocaceae cyanobacterium]|nr:hypothetical protein [Nostocaceae cyanobacterium]